MSHKKKLRIGLLIPELLKEGGGERQCVYLADELVKRGHKVKIFTLEYRSGSCFPDICRRLKIQATGRSLMSTANFPIYSRVKEFFDMKKMAAALNEDFDVLNPHAWPTHWAATTVKQKTRVPVVWMCNDFMIPEIKITAGISAKTKVKNYIANLRRSVLFAYDQPLVNKIDKVIVLDKRVKQIVGQAYRAQPLLIRSGVDLAKFKQNSNRASETIRDKYKINKSAFLLLSVSILLPHRRMEDVVEALRMLTDKGYELKLLHVGSLTYDTAYSQKIISLVNKYQLQDKVIFAGSVSEAALPSYYHACDAFIFPNHKQTWGLAVTEAMACNKPVIVSTGAGVHEILTDEKTGLLIPPKRPDKIGEQIAKLIENPNVAEVIALNGYKLISEQFSWSKYADRMLETFQQSLAKR